MADRGFSATIETALDGREVAAGIFVYLNWPSGAVYVWSGNGSISWNSQTWVGLGKFASVDKITDSVDKADVGVELTLNFLDDTLRNEINTTAPVGRDAAIYFALLNPATGAVIDGYQFFTGFIDRIEIEDGGQTGTLKVRLASELARLQRPRFFALSDAHQQFLFSGDKGCEFATKMDETIYWGRKPVTPVVPIVGQYTDPNAPGYTPWWPQP